MRRANRGGQQILPIYFIFPRFVVWTFIQYFMSCEGMEWKEESVPKNEQNRKHLRKRMKLASGEKPPIRGEKQRVPGCRR
jgi:hypothetical protein